MHTLPDVFRRHFVTQFLGMIFCASPVLPDKPLPTSEPDKLPQAVDLRPQFDHYGLERRQQGSRPTCSVFTVVGALEFAAAKSHRQSERLSVEFLNWAANQRRRHPRDGGFFSDIWNSFAAYGICKEQDMPYRPEFDPSQTPKADVLSSARSRLELGLKFHWIKEWNVNTGLSDSEFRDVEHTLSQGWPVCGGFRWPKQEKWMNDVLEMCPPDAVYDGHSVLLVGYRRDTTHPGGGVFIFRNTSRGGRDGFMPYEYARAYMNDAAWIALEIKPNGGEPRLPADLQNRYD